MAHGVGAIESGDYKSAVEAFRAAAAEKPGDVLATLYLGVALTRLGDAAAEVPLREARAKDPDNPRIPLELGVFYYSRGMYAEAEQEFEATVDMAPGTDLAKHAESYLEAIREKGAPRRWGVNLTVGGQYDTNVILGPGNQPLPQGITRQSDWRAVFLGNARYTLLDREKGSLVAAYSFYQSFHNDLTGYNMQLHLPELRAGYDLRPWLHARAGYAFEYVTIGGDRYDDAHQLLGSLAFDIGPKASATVDYRWRREQYYNAPLFETNSDRTGTAQLVGITVSGFLTDTIQGRAGYAHDLDRTRKDYWDYDGDRGFAGVNIRFPHRIFFDLTADYWRKRYLGVYPGTGLDRDDKTLTLGGAAGISLTSRYALFAGYSYTDNRSSIPSFEYTRGITSLFFNARF